MNIKEHIEAGHYPRDESGRALVPMRDGRTVVIYATDRVCRHGEIVGHIEYSVHTWSVFGASGYPHDGQPTGRQFDILPPAPRKVKVTRWAVIRTADQSVMDTAATRVVELTGEYDEPWQ